MTDLALHQYPDHVAHKGDTIIIDDDPFVIVSVKPKREAGCFLDFGRIVEYSEVVIEVERFDGQPR